MNKKSQIIAEIGVNHNNNRQLLSDLIHGCHKSGADIVKFQRFVSADEISIHAKATPYQEAAGYSSQLELAKSLELCDDDLIFAYNLCSDLSVQFLCSPFDLSSIDFLADKLSQNHVKVPSPEITNLPYLRAVARRFPTIYLSTGASDLCDVAFAVKSIFSINPSCNLTLLHCVSEYPAPFDSLNLNVLSTLRTSFNLPVGFSDHTIGTYASLAAISLGSSVIEKHVTLDRSLPGPDHKASISLDELETICSFSAAFPQMLGTGLKSVSPVENKNKDLIRKSLYINVPFLPEGTILASHHLSAKRPYNSSLISPNFIDLVLGSKLKRSLSFDDGLSFSALSL